MAAPEMPSWEEWAGLTKDQREYSLHKTLNAINKYLAESERSCQNREIECMRRFIHLEKKKKWNSTESLIGGIIGGIMAVIGSWAFWRGPS